MKRGMIETEACRIISGGEHIKPTGWAGVGSAIPVMGGKYSDVAAISKSRLFFRVKRPARLRNRGYDLTFPPITGIAGD